jgi:hypothetical protein
MNESEASELARADVHRHVPQRADNARERFALDGSGLPALESRSKLLVVLQSLDEDTQRVFDAAAKLVLGCDARASSTIAVIHAWKRSKTRSCTALGTTMIRPARTARGG